MSQAIVLVQCLYLKHKKAVQVATQHDKVFWHRYIVITINKHYFKMTHTHSDIEK